jgi:hypothetical protein
VHRTLVGAPTTTLVRRPPTHFAVLPRSPEPTGLPRTHLPRTRVHKDKREGQWSQAPPGPLVSLPQLPRRRYRPALAQRSLRVRHERPLGCSRWHGSARRSDLWGRCAYDGYGRAPDRAALEGGKRRPGHLRLRRGRQAHIAGRAAGARVVYPPEDAEWGTHRYRVLDPEGYEWSFGTYRPGG